MFFFELTSPFCAVVAEVVVLKKKLSYYLLEGSDDADGCCFSSIHYGSPFTLSCDSDCSARKGDNFVIMACFRLIRDRKLSAIFFAVSGGYVKLVDFV